MTTDFQRAADGRASASGLTFEEMSESVTGYDEIAAEKALGMDIYRDAEAKPVLLVRALVFIHLRRPEGGGLTDPEAKERVLSMPLGEANAYFEADDEIDPDQPDGPSGEGEPGLEAGQIASPISAS